MAGDRQLLLYWDPELDGAFRRRLERAMGELRLDASDASAVDIDPDAPPPIRLALISSRGSASANADIVVLAGPGDFPKANGALRIEAADIENQTRRWSAFLDRLANKLERPSLTVAPEDLEVQLDEASRRADVAERARAEFELRWNNADRLAKQAEAALASARAEITEQKREIERLTALSETTAFSLVLAPAAEHDAITSARNHLWRARLAAARADEMAARHPDALTFPNASATYCGSAENKVPHGYGVMTFREGATIVAVYRGAFANGVRRGHGVSVSDGGLVWSGEWNNNEAAGFGVLETPDGRRFEGEVAPDKTGAPKRVRGWTWPFAGRAASEPHRPVAPLLPSPAKSLANS